MRKNILTLLIVLCSYSIYAQKTISGTVADVNAAIPGVNVLIKGTQKGAITDFDGKYSIEASADDVLIFSYIGYKTQEITISNQDVYNIILEEDQNLLDEVVVTALGIKRSKKALGYSVTEIKSDELSKNGEINPISSLSGKIAGVNISQTTAGPSGSKRVLIRGISSMEGDNQPLYVIDGVPIDNSTQGQATEFGGFDLGDGTSDITPEDIESISVLKGASASALYGTRALNGVILITTKSGRKGSKYLDVDFNSTITVDKVLTKLDEYQTIYGQGSNGILPRIGQPANSITSAWGPRLSDASRTILQQDDTEHPYTLNKNNIQDFFNIGTTHTNSFSVTSGYETGSTRFSYSNVTNDDIIPESGLEKNSFTLRSKNNLNDFIELDAKASYITENVNNRPALTDDVNNIGNGLVGLVPNFDQAWLQTYKDENGNYIDYTGNIYRANPYWTINETFNKSKKNRFIGFASLNIDLGESFDLRVRTGIDRYDFNFLNFFNKNTPTKQGGLYLDINSVVQEINYDALLTYSKEINEDFDLTVSLGGNILKNESKLKRTEGSEIIEPDISSINNFNNVIVSPASYNKEIHSIYSFAQISYKDFAFLDVTARNDWSSTLPLNNNSFFYPSVSGSLVFTDALDIDNDLITYGKVRASWAQVGGDTDPYRLSLTYRLTGLSFNGNSQGEILESFIPNANLKPQETTSYEFGTDLRFFQNKVGIDFTYYNQTTDNQILSVEVPPASGYESAILNSGSLKNKGVELQLSATPIDKDFKWDIIFNYSKIWNNVESLHDDVDALTIANARWSGVSIVALEGEEFGQIIGRGYKRDSQGNIIHDATTGLPMATDNPIILGSISPDWTGGVINKFSYKNFTLKTSLDVKIGGDIYSITNRGMFNGGTHTATLGGRDSFNDWASRNEQARLDFIANGGSALDYVPLDLDGGYIGNGVKLVGVDADGNEIYEENDVLVNPQTYWQHASTSIPETNVYDASYVKLRELSVSYSLPKKYLSKLSVKEFTFSLIGRNLFTLYKNVPNIDPESTYNNGNGQGLEYGSLPTRRQYGLNLSVKF